MNKTGKLNTPVLLLIFDRKDFASRIMNVIRQAQPEHLYIAADGPRNDRPGHIEICRETRQFVIDTVDWPCHVETLFRDENMGCKMAVSSAISWFFDRVDRGIILEDDCIPDLSFFEYCQDLLLRYESDERVAAISGDRLVSLGKKFTGWSYRFSIFSHLWGWATWRRAWAYYDLSMSHWPGLRESSWLERLLTNPDAARYWRMQLESVYQGKIDTWDYQWVFACWVNSGLTISPNVNMISNIGFGPTATHTKNRGSELANLRCEQISFPLKHPDSVMRDYDADFEECVRLYQPGSVQRGIVSVIRRIGRKTASWIIRLLS